MNAAPSERLTSRVAQSSASSDRPLDLLAVPGLRSLLLRRRWMQGPLLFISIVLVVHGFAGPQLAPKNLATLVGWVHSRGLLVVGLLVMGNAFCMACPFMLPRDLARRLHAPKLAWPRALRGKHVGIALFVGVLFVYEWLDLWASPSGTAWLLVGYFALVVLVDALFKGAPFCKSVCPIGQFNFAASALSPFEVVARDSDVCASCSGHECLRGSESSRGCETNLFLPEKAGNMDCTFCLDCARACPHENVGIVARLPGAELSEDRSAAGVGRRSARPDLALLATVFTFGALLNAFGMVSPVYVVQQQIASWMGTTSEGAVLLVLFASLLVVEPVLLLGVTAAISRRAMPRREPVVAVAARFSHGLVPLGFGVWLAHYGFHLLTGLWTFVPVTQKAVADAFGVALLGAPQWDRGGLTTRAVQPIEMGMLLLGAIGSLGVLWAIAKRQAPERPRAAFAPWGVLTVLLLAAAVWLMAQPMEMRGTFLQ
ncbi:MAG: FesM [Planctomycetes bacterium]|nr:FesM [Planctomycetota bacterium]